MQTRLSSDREDRPAVPALASRRAAGFPALLRGAFRGTLAFFLLLLLESSALAELRAGAAKVAITPDVTASAVPLGGYAARKGKPATGVHDPIFARALALEDGGAWVAVVSVDLCFVPANLKIEVLRRLKTAGVTGLTSERLLLAATHTHSAPDPLAMHAGNRFDFSGWPRFDPQLLSFTADRIAEAVAQARQAMQPATLRSAQFLVGPVTVEGGARLESLNRNRRGEKITDREMTLLLVQDRTGRPLATLCNYAAHPTLYDDAMREISGDWPGVLTARLEANVGGVCLFLNGAEGDVAPNGAVGETAAQRAQNYGERVAATAEATLRTLLDLHGPAPAPDSLTLAAWTETVKLPPRKPSALFLLAAGELGVTVAQAKEVAAALMPQTTQIGFVQVGELLLIGLPCEPVTEIGLAVKAAARKAGYRRPAVVALANDWLAYAVTSAQYQAGGYETSMSFYGVTFGPALVEAAQRGLKRQPSSAGRASGTSPPPRL